MRVQGTNYHSCCLGSTCVHHQAAFLPVAGLEWSVPNDYRKEVITLLSSARALAVESMERAQKRHKRNYDQRTKQLEF